MSWNLLIVTEYDDQKWPVNVVSMEYRYFTSRSYFKRQGVKAEENSQTAIYKCTDLFSPMNFPSNFQCRF